ncbi:hypothetical protein QN362_16455 [Actimicrobium sp. CCC2.4]|uniref:hypothetical protein n=1 Tax=Actimicrobium sp. CCC2.4 TaxID=3048606 RepID=UPI002AC9E8E3|nr:hypothetical protein [Actimicrobium sp. CCC2.4]MEB0136929.1 hypothetical protein [Actimicrobium sp. CCC2.4]WPX32706.1 hypothetical protein RHM62_02305 [Actimicrobium sp. CCC2.4]
MSIITTLKEGLVVGAKLIPDNPYDRYTLHEALEHAGIPADAKPENVLVEWGHRGTGIAVVPAWMSGQLRSVTRCL